MASIKRDQILQEAEKLAARGKLEAAIKEYRRAADQAPNDTNTLNRLGDLLQRVGRVGEAIDVYQKIAEHFAEDGFFLKSIAIYKKVNRLDPQRTETYERLADLYFKQGLVVEGRQQLSTLADWFLRSKQPAEAVRVYRRLVELEPANFQGRAKLVDLLVQIGDAAAVKVEIDALGTSLLQRGMLDEAVKLYHRALDLSPQDAEFVAPCVNALVAANRNAQAIELARKALATGKAGIELQLAAARASAEAGDLRAARKLLEGILPNVGERTDVLQLYGDVMLRVGETEEAKGLLLPVMDRLIKAGDVARTAALVKKLLYSSPGDAEVLERALKVFDRHNDPDMVLNIEAALADAYARAGRRLDAIGLYRRLAQEQPHNATFAQRLEALGVSHEVAQPLPPVPIPEPPVSIPAPAAASEPGVEFVDIEFTPEPVGGPSTAPTHPGPVETAPPAPLASSGKPEISPTDAEELFTEAVVFAKYGLSDKAIGHLHRLLALVPTHAQGRELLRSLGGGEMTEAQFGDAKLVPPVAAMEGVPPPAGVGAVAPSGVSGVPELPEFAALTGSPVAVRDVKPARPIPVVEIPVPGPVMSEAATSPLPALEELVRAAVPAPARSRPSRSGVGPVRLDDLEAVLGVGGSPPRRPAKAPAAAAFEFDLEGLGLSSATLRSTRPAPPPPESQPSPPPEAPAAAPPQPSPQPAKEDEQLEQPIELLEVPGMLAGPSEDQLRELDFFIQQGLLDDAAKLLAKVTEAFGDHPEVVARHALLKARGWDGERPAVAAASAAELFSEEEHFFDLAAELEKELAEDELVAEATGEGKGEDVSIEELFKEFQKGVAEQVQEADYDTHFNLGLAYREMGLLDEAIGEFQLSAKSAEYLLESASMVGACYLEKGLPEQAVEWYERALGAPSVAPEVQMGLRYELARAHEVAGNVAAALAGYAEVLAVSPAYRDTVDRIARLRTN
ncbi:MAG: tetratricopeptide repeat protein [Thermoanaerobaculales bacterium]